MGVLTSDVKGQFVDKLDEMIKLKGFVEIIDGMILRIAINLLDDKLFSKINPNYHDELNQAFIEFNNDELDEIPAILDDIIAGEITTPIVDGDEVEKVLYEGLLTILVNLMEVYIIQKNG